ncbi:hypothetical protein L1987_63952 [Smallanthus sonchifolius]|uniref:Uncharacterized protein n=1 Tax=Smallanthus sonchifolius TaxID=185202 RepID=A0ACB9CEM9_9ASTR|nr:hypothetical protein L1987_63952 [Smallanthus sonchifolius]
MFIQLFVMLTWLLLQNYVGEETHFAIETSGHGALKENHWLEDGAYLMKAFCIICANNFRNPKEPYNEVKTGS